MNLARFWHQNLRWTLILWFIAAFLLRTGWPIFLLGVVVWLLLIYYTAPGVFWTFVYTLPLTTANSDLATNLLQKAVSCHPQIAFPYLALGIIRLRAKDSGEAVSLLEEAVRLSDRKSVSNVKIILAIAYRESGQYEKTYALLDELVSHGIRNLKIYYNYGLCYLRQKRFAEALEAAETARSFNINQLEPVLLLGQIYFEMGDYQKAKDNWEWAVNRNPQLVEPYYWLGRAELELGEIKGAVDHLQLAVERITKDPILSNVTAAEAEAWLEKAKAGR